MAFHPIRARNWLKFQVSKVARTSWINLYWIYTMNVFCLFASLETAWLFSVRPFCRRHAPWQHVMSRARSNVHPGMRGGPQNRTLSISAAALAPDLWGTIRRPNRYVVSIRSKNDSFYCTQESCHLDQPLVRRMIDRFGPVPMMLWTCPEPQTRTSTVSLVSASRCGHVPAGRRNPAADMFISN